MSDSEEREKKQLQAFRRDGEKKAIEQQEKGMMLVPTVGFKVVAWKRLKAQKQRWQTSTLTD